MARRPLGSRGFTLLELMAVFAVIALILAVAAPRLLPMATHFGHEGAARELAAFGESAIQHAKLNNQEVYVNFDLDTGAYWVERWAPEDPDAGEAGFNAVDLQNTIENLLNDPDAGEEDLLNGMKAVRSHFGGFAEQRLRARAELVEPNRNRDAKSSTGVMRASWNDATDDRDPRLKKEPFEAPMLEPRRLPKNVFFESVTLPDTRTRGQLVEVVISPLGLERDVRIKLIGEDGDVLTVRWDPIVERGFVYSGALDP